MVGDQLSDLRNTIAQAIWECDEVFGGKHAPWPEGGDEEYEANADAVITALQGFASRGRDEALTLTRLLHDEHNIREGWVDPLRFSSRDLQRTSFEFVDSGLPAPLFYERMLLVRPAVSKEETDA